MRKSDGVRSRIKTIALIAFGGYVLWNATWLLRGCTPPSILTFCTGLPCPTTGMTRSVLALSRGDMQSFFLFNPLTSVYVALTGISAVMLLRRFLQTREAILPASVGWAWLLVLVTGWITKFALGSKYW